MSHPVFTLVIPTLSGHRRLCRLLNTAATAHPFRVCIVDNAEERRSVAASWNLGIQTAFEQHGSRYAIVANDDILFHPQCLDAMVRAADDGHPFVNCQILHDPNDLATRCTQGGFSLFLASRVLVEAVGWFDQAFAPAYFEDNDYFYRMKLACIPEHVSPDAGFYHHRFGVNGRELMGWTTTYENPAMRLNHRAVLLANRARYIEKWGGMPGDETFKVPFDGAAS